VSQDEQGSLSRPPRLKVEGQEYITRSLTRDVEIFKASLFGVLKRFIIWLYYAFYFLAGIIWDALCRRNTVYRRANRLRQILERAGATAIKIGQQLSMRVDLLPYAYTQELEKLLDQVPAFPVEEAIHIIEEATRKPLAETFPVFDSVPIGSASIACVYQALLSNGVRVAIKVRRPGIGERFAVDLRALNWLLWLLELFVLPSSFTRRAIYELKTMLMEELDFLKEARYTELFRRNVKKAKFRYAIAPRVYFDLSNRQVLVTEFVSGIQLTDILRAVEHKDQEALLELRDLGIDPKVVAQRLLRIIRFSGFEGLFFNADPHPANIFVQPDNHLVFIDFGSCGAFTNKDLLAWRQLLYAHSIEDVHGMVHAALALLEPLAAIDIDEFSQKLETMFFQDLYAHKSKHAEWWERTSAHLWYQVFALMKEYQIPLNLNLFRMIRATMLSDSLAARLHPKINQYREYQKYERGADKRARRRLEQKLWYNFSSKWGQLERLVDNSYRLTFLTQRFLSFPLLHFARQTDKTAYFFGVLIKTALSFLIVILGLVATWKFLDLLSTHDSNGSVWRIIRDWLFARPYGEQAVGLLGNVQQLLVDKWWYYILIVLGITPIARQVLRRLERKDRRNSLKF
jgi:ubiquinone biosynthesis protein